MRIISDFKDYYDSAQGFGLDPAITYVRKQKRYTSEYREWGHKEWKDWMPSGMKEAVQPHLDSLVKFPCEVREESGENLNLDVTVKLVGFCGHLYPMLEIAGTTFESTEKFEGKVSLALLKRHGISKDKLRAALAQEYKPAPAWRWRSRLTHGTWHAAVSEFKDKRIDDVFIALGVPIFKLECTSINERGAADTIQCTLNPFLKAEQFQRLKGPAEAYQDIAMYLGNQLARQPDPISNTPDEILRDEKGFDEWSFRRHKEESKKFKRKS